MATKRNGSLGIIGKRYPAFKENEDSGFMPAVGEGYASSGLFNRPIDSGRHAKGDREQVVRKFPSDRFAQYPLLEKMIADPINEAAITMHVYHALSSKTETGEVIFIEPRDGNKNDKIVKDLNNTFAPMINGNAIKWGFLTALYGFFAPRIYSAPKTGVSHVMDDFYSNPKFIRQYLRGGSVAGYTHFYQQSPIKSGKIKLIEPWKFIPFSIQQNTFSSSVEPTRLRPFDIERDDYWNDEPIESTSYGSSLMSTAYDPWMDFTDSLLSLSLSRRNASKRDRFVGIETGKAHPQKAAQYYNMVAEQLQRKATESARRSLREGYVSSVDNHLFPIWSNGNGRVNIQTEDSPVDVSGVEDVHMHLNRLCAAHGLDKSLLGWGDSMAGSLGEGGFFRQAITAAIRGSQIRRAMAPGFENMFEIHVAQKHGKVFTEKDKPWTTRFNSLNTAIENEESESRERQAMYATSVATLMQILDPEMSKFGFKETTEFLLAKQMGISEDDVSILIKSVKETSETDDEADKNNLVNDSLDSLSHDEKLDVIYQAMGLSDEQEQNN